MLPNFELQVSRDAPVSSTCCTSAHDTAPVTFALCGAALPTRRACFYDVANDSAPITTIHWFNASVTSKLVASACHDSQRWMGAYGVPGFSKKTHGCLPLSTFEFFSIDDNTWTAESLKYRNTTLISIRMSLLYINLAGSIARHGFNRRSS